MAQNAGVSTVEVETEQVAGGVNVLIKKFGVGSDATGRFKVSSYIGVEPAQDLVLFLPYTEPEFNLQAFGEILSKLSQVVVTVVKKQAAQLEHSFYEEIG